MNQWINDNAWWIGIVCPLVVLWCRHNYTTREPPAADASVVRWFFWRAGEFIAVTRWDELGFLLKPVPALGKAFPPLLPEERRERRHGPDDRRDPPEPENDRRKPPERQA